MKGKGFCTKKNAVIAWIATKSDVPDLGKCMTIRKSKVIFLQHRSGRPLLRGGAKTPPLLLTAFVLCLEKRRMKKGRKE
jgi:hypothetical protein